MVSIGNWISTSGIGPKQYGVDFRTDNVNLWFQTHKARFPLVTSRSSQPARQNHHLGNAGGRAGMKPNPEGCVNDLSFVGLLHFGALSSRYRAEGDQTLRPRAKLWPAKRTVSFGNSARRFASESLVAPSSQGSSPVGNGKRICRPGARRVPLQSCPGRLCGRPKRAGHALVRRNCKHRR